MQDGSQTSMTAQILALQRMSVSELQRRWLDVFGEPTRSRNHRFLWRRIAWELQARVHGGLSERAQERIRELAPAHFPRAILPRGAFADVESSDVARRSKEPSRRRDPRLPQPGSVITKTYKGRELRLIVRDDHFELDGRSFASLSEAARYATGARWDGFLYWGLKPRRRKA